MSFKDLDNLKWSHDGYINPLKELLKKTGHTDSKFNFCGGDIQHPECIITLAKNRSNNHNDSVLLRCLTLKRHWGKVYKPPKDMKWEKKINKVFWRGASTGKDRIPFVKKWLNKDSRINVGLSELAGSKKKLANELSPFIKEKVDPQFFLNFKYIISIPGNDKDSGINWKLNSNSLVLMARPKISSWLMETTLVPGYHYVLLKDDYSDLLEKFLWCESNEKKCLEIIKNANKFMDQFKNIKKEERIEKKVINKYFTKLA